MADPIKRIVLVHGASHGAWCWELVVPLLEARGHRVQAIDLPGSGDDPTPPQEVTLDGYVRAVVAALQAGEGPALLVGHSMGGLSISAAAEAVPDAVARLVYLTAVLPQDGETMRDAIVRPGGADGSPAPRLSHQADTHALVYDDPQRVFYHLCPPEMVDRAIARLRPQALAPGVTPLRLSPERWGRVPKTYVLCEQDQALPLTSQRMLCDRLPDIRRRRLRTDHSPFYSDPEALAAILDEEAREA